MYSPRITGATPRSRAAVVIKLVSADSLRKTGISAHKARDFRRFPPQHRQTGSRETKSNTRKAGISGPFSRFLELLAEPMNGWLGGRIRTAIWRIGNRTLSPLREKAQNPFPWKFISNSKRSNFENRTEARALEKNGPSENQLYK